MNTRTIPMFTTNRGQNRSLKKRTSTATIMTTIRVIAAAMMYGEFIFVHYIINTLPRDEKSRALLAGLLYLQTIKKMILKIPEDGMKKRIWHALAVERIKSETSQILKKPDEREDVRGERMAVIEELIGLLEKSFLAPEAVAEVRTEFSNLLGTFPRKVSGHSSLVRRYLRQTLRKLK